ncbi:NAD(+)/NADH kinase [Paenactinomyces guangxiensis]|uniref:NAD kinase n=1 Tax=Paenactinomyces guangxiensis TaxID=1490290 RepID=A0A7W1WS30_9BACL|nr:NAD(+)/NADH kinase [Paenactinomyces guangxiensis]MBA4495006.1 NAD(+)/NADH kinase [Paenactinomyces guangxiensis]MBH8592089.1 NAD(+)/NADH kinase [Paenactinomyces guangxiensis]
MKTIGITINQDKPKAHIFVHQLLQLLERKGSVVYVEPGTAKALGRAEIGLELDCFPQKVDLVFVLGGDGTLLGIARQFAEHHLPILGFNVGHLGFLSEAEPGDLSTAVDRVLAGDYYIEERLMLTAELVRQGEVIEKGTALNDIGIAKGSFGRMITCTAYMDGIYLGTYSGDGLIVSTPTGSTAYSLSCGGPIVYPDIQTLLLTPICPHTLTSRPMVLPAESVLEIKVSAAHREMEMTIDGQLGYCLKEDDIVRVSRSPFNTLLIKWQERSFFEVIRKKLQGESVDESRAGGTI